MRWIVALGLALSASLFGGQPGLANPLEDQAAANRVLVGAALRLSALRNDGPVLPRLEELQRIIAELDRIVRDYPGTDLAVRLATGQDVGIIRSPALRLTLANLQDAACPERPNLACLVRTVESLSSTSGVDFQQVAHALIHYGNQISDVLSQRGNLPRDASQFWRVYELVVRGDVQAARSALASSSFIPVDLVDLRRSLAFRTLEEVDIEALQRAVETSDSDVEKVPELALADLFTAARQRNLAAFDSIISNHGQVIEGWISSICMEKGVLSTFLRRPRYSEVSTSCVDWQEVQLTLRLTMNDLQGQQHVLAQFAPDRRQFIELLLLRHAEGESDAFRSGLRTLAVSPNTATPLRAAAALIFSLRGDRDGVRAIYTSIDTFERAGGRFAMVEALARVGMVEECEVVIQGAQLPATALQLRILAALVRNDLEAVASLIWPNGPERPPSSAALSAAIIQWDALRR